MSTIIEPTVGNVQGILTDKIVAEETIVIELAGFLASQQTMITHGSNGNQPFRRTPSGKYVISDGIVRDMADVGSFAGVELPELFQDMFTSMEIEYFDPLGFDEPIPYSIAQ